MKIDCHRHLSGSISPETVARVAGLDSEIVRDIMVYQPGDEHDYKAFFPRFKFLNQVEWTPYKIDLIIQDFIWYLKKEGIEYTEVKFSLDKYIGHLDMPYKDMFLLFAKLFDTYCSHWGVVVDLTLAIKHDGDKQIQKEICEIIKDDKVASCVSGIDMVGDENYFDPYYYKDLYQLWHDAGKICMAHVGEIDQEDHVIQAIDLLNVDRVCHGIAAADNLDIAAMSRDKLIAFDVSITSNVCTGVAQLETHPVIKMIENGFVVSLGTDDPMIFNTTLKEEYKIFQKITGLSDEEVDLIKWNNFHFSAQEIMKRKQK